MKKLTILFLALSAVAFGRLNSGYVSSEIDVTVTATVTDVAPSLTITDENNEPISSIYFEHEMESGNADHTLSKKLRVQGNALNNTTLNKLDGGFEKNTLMLFNESGTNDLNAQLSSSFGNTTTNVGNSTTLKYVDLEIISNVTGTATPGMYTEPSTVFTVTFNK